MIKIFAKFWSELLKSVVRTIKEFAHEGNEHINADQAIQLVTMPDPDRDSELLEQHKSMMNHVARCAACYALYTRATEANTRHRGRFVKLFASARL